MFACTAGCAPSGARRPRGIWNSSTSQIPYAASANFIPVGAMSPSGANREEAHGDRRSARSAHYESTTSRSSSPTSTAPAPPAPTVCLMQAIFRMGIPVSGKNLFPSNIQGLPTWYEIRVNKSGLHRARARLRPRGRDELPDLRRRTSPTCVTAATSSTTRRGRSTPTSSRDDVTFLGVPLAKMCLENFQAPRERILMKNIAYAGCRRGARRYRRRDRRRSARRDLRAQRSTARVEPTGSSSRLRLRHGELHVPAAVPRRAMDANDDSILIDGNTATALGCLYAGATVAGWYPITPATAVMDNFIATLRNVPAREGRERRP
jgi:hypothetical protein